MHNIYVTLSQLRSLDGVVILKDISIEDICKAKFKKGVIRDDKTSFRPKKISIQMISEPTKILKFLQI
jgi:hypothetical protein